MGAAGAPREPGPPSRRAASPGSRESDTSQWRRPGAVPAGRRDRVNDAGSLPPRGGRAPRYHTRRSHRRAEEGRMSERELTYGEAVREAIAEEMRRDPTVFLIGEDVAEAGHPFKTLVGLVDEFGTKRVIDTPISEPGYAGIGVGAARTGMRPIGGGVLGDFITLTMDQMVNQAAKAHYMS